MCDLNTRLIYNLDNAYNLDTCKLSKLHARLTVSVCSDNQLTSNRTKDLLDIPRDGTSKHLIETILKFHQLIF